MKSYRDSTGKFHRTQADAKASGHPWELVDIPTDHAGLIAWVNDLGGRVVAVTHDETSVDLPMGVELHDGPASDVVTSSDQLAPYTNGQPTSTFLRSRNPIAIFTCTECGHLNRNQGQ